jgi:hypothetical protein
VVSPRCRSRLCPCPGQSRADVRRPKQQARHRHLTKPNQEMLINAHEARRCNSRRFAGAFGSRLALCDHKRGQFFFGPSNIRVALPSSWRDDALALASLAPFRLLASAFPSRFSLALSSLRVVPSGCGKNLYQLAASVMTALSR